MSNFDFSAEYILEDERVLLRPLQISDVDHLLVYALNEPEIWHYSYRRAGGSRGNLEAYIKSALDARAKEKEYPFIVYDKKAKAYAGSTRFYDIHFQDQTLHLGYTWYGKAFQGTGLNKYCKFLLLQFAFEKMGIERVEFRADFDNKKSIAAMKSIGCIEEGVLRSDTPRVDGGRRDSIVLSILKSEWAHVKESLAARLI
jgi:RimJ/RimL family protein N-acetyltransferase